jgi:hypothetical protein
MLISNVSNTTSCKTYFNELKIKTLPCIYIYEILVRVKMSLNRFTINYLIYSYNTRNKSNLYVTDHNTKLYGQCLTHNSLPIFNKLSSEIKHSEPITKFKKISYSFLIEKCFYSAEEFMTMDSELVNYE